MDFDVAGFISRIGVSILPFMFAITIHEVSHGFVAYLLGDNTAKNDGRLTLNPINHLDIMGLLVLLLSQMIGWAKPVPVNFGIVGRIKYGPLMVAAAGPVSNFIMAFISALLLKGLVIWSPQLPPNLFEFLVLTLIGSTRINTVLAIFNLIPLPPMDGGRILHNLLPRDKAVVFAKIEPYGMIILLILVFTGVIREFLGPVFDFLFKMFYSIAL